MDEYLKGENINGDKVKGYSRACAHEARARAQGLRQK
jgi:hypothetical protein